MPAQLNLDVRLSIVESRLGRLESDVAALTRVPEQLARMEAVLENLDKKASGNAGVIQSVAMTFVTGVISAVIAYHVGKRSHK